MLAVASHEQARARAVLAEHQSREVARLGGGVTDDVVVDFDAPETACPACGTTFETAGTVRCPDCGLRFA